ncbi:MAG TPA: enoyl-CoA hydratase [Syntrophus sp. (in: bacteria)]|nr:enoyl-CoA hydratase [Syntrophus sp. (in: bacteria)]
MTVSGEWTNVTFDEIRVGMAAEISVTLTGPQIDLMSMLSGDVDAFHLTSSGDENPRGPTRRTEASGAVTLLSNLIGTRLPGPGTKIQRRDLVFDGDIVTGDTLTAKVTVREKRKRGRLVVFDCTVINQEKRKIVSGKTVVAAPVQRLIYDDVAPAHLELRRSDAFMNLFKSCTACEPVTCAIVHPCDVVSLSGAVEAARRGFITPVLVGPEEKIRQAAAEAEIDLAPYRIISTPHSHAAADRAVELARAGKVESLMKGSLHTDELLGAVMSSSTGLRTARRISHAFVMDVPAYPKMFIMTDAAVNISPSLTDKRDIIQNAIDLAQMLGIGTPKVGILSAVETVNARLPSTIDAAALCKMADRGQITGGILDGPLAFDNAISAQAAKTKGINSPVSGDVDILLAPDLDSGNMLLKQLTYLAGAEGAGIVLGGRVPVVLTSRSDSLRTRLASTAVMTIVAQARRTGKYEV